MEFRLLADENTSHRLISACQQAAPHFPMIHIASWQDGGWRFGRQYQPSELRG